jgi:Phospholipid methyltransferase
MTRPWADHQRRPPTTRGPRVEGLGTPAPIAPIRRLVVGGPYRYVRNPMYLAVTAVIVGQALAFGQLWLLLYAAAVGAAMAAFAHGYEEPTLRRQCRGYLSIDPQPNVGAGDVPLL